MEATIQVKARCNEFLKTYNLVVVDLCSNEGIDRNDFPSLLEQGMKQPLCSQLAREKKVSSKSSRDKMECVVHTAHSHSSSP